MKLTFSSTKYASLKIPLGGDLYAEFKDHRFETEDRETMRKLLASPAYGQGFTTPGAFYVVTPSGGIRNGLRGGAQKLKYPPELVKEVSIIIGTHLNPQCLKECLESLVENTPKGYQLIVVANDTDDKSKELIRSFGAQMIETTQNLGFAQFNNLAVSRVRRPYILFLNDDTVLRKYWLESMVYLMKRVKNCGIVGKASFTSEGRPLDHANGREGVAHGHCLLIRRAKAYFDEVFEVGGWEDYDLSERIKAKGLKIVIEREYPIIHKGHQTVNKLPDKLQVFARNQAIFERRVKSGYYQRY